MAIYINRPPAFFAFFQKLLVNIVDNNQDKKPNWEVEDRFDFPIQSITYKRIGKIPLQELAADCSFWTP